MADITWYKNSLSVYLLQTTNGFYCAVLFACFTAFC